jgi:hypothetical protein
MTREDRGSGQPAAGSDAAPLTPEAYLDGDELGLAVLERVLAALTAADRQVETRVTKSQIAFRRRRGLAYLWRPERYLGRRAEGIVVLSIALGRRDASARWKEVNQVSPAHWMHHLEVRGAAEIDDEVAGWLLEAAARAG